MPRYPVQKETNPEVVPAEAEAPIVRRLSSSDIELSPVAVRPVAPETIELAPGPTDAEVQAVLDEPVPEVVTPVMRPLAVADKPLHAMTREELMAALANIQKANPVLVPANEAPQHERPKMTERQMTQREAELARGAERSAQHAATMVPRRPPLTAVVENRAPQSLARPVPHETVETRAPADAEYVPDMKHGYVETGDAKRFNDSHRE